MYEVVTSELLHQENPHTIRVGLTALMAFALLAVPMGCSNGDGNTTPANKSGGTKTTVTGGNISSTGGTTTPPGGASTNTGGTPASTGGNQAGGNPSGSGGVTTGSGGATGNTTLGGSKTGGIAASGGVPTNGGATGSGGVLATGGAPNGGSNTVCSTVADAPIPIVPGGPLPKAGDLWVSPNGNDSGDGSEGSPLQSLVTAVGKVAAGQTIWMMAGVHKFSETVFIGKKLSGSASQPFRIAGVTGGARPVLDFTGVNQGSEIRGLQLDGNYWHVRYLEIFGASDNCVNISGSYNTIELLAVHDCKDTGVQINSVGTQMRDKCGYPAHNRILNVDSYLNVDGSKENADGFAAKLFVGEGNSFEGCRAWYNCDDSYDLYEAMAVVTFKNCWAIRARHPESNSNSDGNGFKLGGIKLDQPAYVERWQTKYGYATYADYLKANANAHQLENCFAFDNPTSGFDRNNNPSTEITCKGCGAWNNGTNVEPGINIVGELISLPNVTHEMAIKAQRNADGSLPDIRTLK